MPAITWEDLRAANVFYLDALHTEDGEAEARIEEFELRLRAAIGDGVSLGRFALIGLEFGPLEALLFVIPRLSQDKFDHIVLRFAGRRRETWEALRLLRVNENPGHVLDVIGNLYDEPVVLGARLKQTFDEGYAASRSRVSGSWIP